jgi:hypothetical protein
MKKFLIAEAEKARILGMHYNAMGKKLVSEQKRDPEEFRKAGIDQLTAISSDDLSRGDYAVYFTENTNGTSHYYTCATNPKHGNDPWNKPGAVFDSNYKLSNSAFVLSNTPEFKSVMAKECKVVFDYLAQQKAKNAPQAQVAGATASKPVSAPNPVSDADVAAKEKMGQQTKLNIQQGQQQLTDKMADANYLNPNKEKAELDKDALEVGKLILSASPISGELGLTVKNRVSRLLKYKPEYKLL